MSMQKQQAGASNPLRDGAILQQVFTFLPGCWLFLGAVCREWNAVYAGIEAHKVQCIVLYGSPKMVTFRAKTTLYSAAVASPAAVRLTLSCGLAISDNKQLQLIAGVLAGIETLAALRELGMPLSERVVEGVALSGRINVLQHLLTEQQCPKPIELSYSAARKGSISMLKWLRTQSWCYFTTRTCTGAALGGHLAALKHLRSEGCGWNKDYIACYAASSGSIEVVEWLRQQGIQINAEVFVWAAGASQIAMCEHLRRTGCEWDSDACRKAADRGRLDTQRWLREHMFPWDLREVCLGASFNGYTDIFDYIIEQGEVLSEWELAYCLNRAGSRGKMDTAQWLRQHGAAWPDVLGLSEQYQWSADMLALARAEGCTSPTVPF
jgi:hypothetical protein